MFTLGSQFSCSIVSFISKTIDDKEPYYYQMILEDLCQRQLDVLLNLDRDASPLPILKIESF